MKYKASLDNLSKTITIILFIVFISVLFVVCKDIIATYNTNYLSIGKIIVPILILVLYIICWAYAPKSYTITPDKLIINRPIGSIVFDRKNFKEINLLSKNDLKGTIRNFGVGGLFGYFGTFTIPKIGEVSFYTTQQKNIILITLTNNKKIAVTPNDLDFINRIML